MATRASSSKVLNQIAKRLPWLVGGSGRPGPSDATLMDGGGDFEAGNYNGRNMHFGIREHAMGAIVNGMCLTGLRRVRVHVLRFHRLHAAFDALWRPSWTCRCFRSSRTIQSASAKTAPRTSRSSIWPHCGRFPVSPSFAPAMPTRWPRPIARHCSTPRTDRPWCSRGRTCPRSIARNMPRPTGAAKGGYVLADAAGGEPEVILIGTGTSFRSA